MQPDSELSGQRIRTTPSPSISSCTLMPGFSNWTLRQRVTLSWASAEQLKCASVCGNARFSKDNIGNCRRLMTFSLIKSRNQINVERRFLYKYAGTSGTHCHQPRVHSTFTRAPRGYTLILSEGVIIIGQKDYQRYELGGTCLVKNERLCTRLSVWNTPPSLNEGV